MKNKEIIQIIKEKANEVQIRDMSNEILEKVGRFSHQQEVIIKPQRAFRLRPVFSLGLVLLVMVTTLILTNPFEKPTPFEEREEVLSQSIIAAVSYASFEASDDLAAGDIDLDTPSYFIDDELDEISRYIQMMERMLSNDQSGHFEELVSDRASFEKMIRLNVQSIIDEEKTLVLYYNLTITSRNKDDFHMTGVLVDDSHEYDVHVTSNYTQGSYHLVFHVVLREDLSIQIRYNQEAPDQNYEIYRIESDVEHTELSFSLSRINNQMEVFAQLLGTHMRGSYRFALTEDEAGKKIDVHYAIIRQTTTETGRIVVIVDVDPDSAQTIYNMTINPRGANPYETNKERPNHPGRGSNANGLAV
ncbi:MAG: hypothetical protein IH571_05555 [Acholeplasmataceae bacterium]|nr:hypothetical protein [Acholeplasmataceae bacterium]